MKKSNKIQKKKIKCTKIRVLQLTAGAHNTRKSFSEFEIFSIYFLVYGKCFWLHCSEVSEQVVFCQDPIQVNNKIILFK